ncbi:MAG: hypothetical protein E7510_02230 [Ruminococcus sp.]|nr:hypothetical protein [Ruminococcus sp.]
MANIEKFATPINNRNIVRPVKEQLSPEAQRADYQNTSKVKQALPDSELLKQHNTVITEQHKGPAAFMSLLKDPEVTVGFMKGIFAMMDVVALLPMKNDAITEEMQQLFAQLNVDPDMIADEMINQENSSTAFKGELFDFLRNLISESKNPEVKNAVISVLKAINSEKSREDITVALSGSFEYLSKEMKPSHEISDKLLWLSKEFASGDMSQKFEHIKSEALEVLYDIERSILFSDRTSKLISMIRYNMSRYNDNPDFLTNSVNYLMTMMTEAEKPEFLQLLYDHLAYYENKDFSESLSDSKVMNVITEILKRQGESEEIGALNHESVENIIHSILSSPSNFTPLLHFIIPVEYEDISSFAEMWIDPDEEEISRDGSQQRIIHMFIVFDIENLGKLEAEFFVRGRDISLSLYCPQESAEYIADISKEIKSCADFSDYRMVDVSVRKFTESRSLVDVFEGLSIKRTGINVRI